MSFGATPLKTLIDGGGDCEDTTILVGAILRGLGEKTALIVTPRTHCTWSQRQFHWRLSHPRQYKVLLL